MKKYTNEDIRVAAYYIWEQLGKPWGKENECWNMALEQLMIYDTTSYSKKTKCATKKVAATTSTTTKNSTKPTTKTTSKNTTKASTKTSLKTTGTTTRSNVKASSSNITDFSHFRSNANSLKTKVSLNTNKNIDTNYNLKNSKKSLI